MNGIIFSPTCLVDRLVKMIYRMILASCQTENRTDDEKFIHWQEEVVFLSVVLCSLSDGCLGRHSDDCSGCGFCFCSPVLFEVCPLSCSEDVACCFFPDLSFPVLQQVVRWEYCFPRWFQQLLCFQSVSFSFCDCNSSTFLTASSVSF